MDSSKSKYIALRSLSFNYNQIVDIREIFYQCKDIFDNKYSVNSILHSLVKNEYVDKTNRSCYEITEKGKLYMENIKNVTFDDIEQNEIDNIIKNTAKHMDLFLEALKKDREKYLKQPVVIKYFKNDKLIDSIKNEINGYSYFYCIEDGKLKLYVFGFDKILAPGSILLQDDIILYTQRERLQFRDL